VEEEEEQMSYPLLMELRSWRQVRSLQGFKSVKKFLKFLEKYIFKVGKAIVRPNADSVIKISARKI
jgi:hypothetical protein